MNLLILNFLQLTRTRESASPTAYLSHCALSLMLHVQNVASIAPLYNKLQTSARNKTMQTLNTQATELDKGMNHSGFMKFPE